MADRSVVSQRLDLPQVDLPPEETSLSLTQLVPELDLLGEKSKDKKDESDEEEVWGENRFFFSGTLENFKLVVVISESLSCLLYACPV